MDQENLTPEQQQQQQEENDLLQPHQEGAGQEEVQVPQNQEEIEQLLRDDDEDITDHDDATAGDHPQPEGAVGGPPPHQLGAGQFGHLTPPASPANAANLNPPVQAPPPPANNNQPPAMPNQNANGVASTEKFKIPMYSGVFKDHSYTSADGPKTETLTAEEWARRVDTLQTAANWTDEVTASTAQLAFIPGQPASDWYTNNFDEDFMKLWSTLRPKFITQFSPYVSVSDKVDILRSFRQKPSELINPYLQRVTKEHNRFKESFNTEMTTKNGPWDPNRPGVVVANIPAKDARDAISKEVFRYYLKNFFALGLRDSLLAEVTKSGVSTLEEMVEVARRAEQASLQGNKRHTVAEVTISDQPTPPSASNVTAEDQGEDKVVAAIKQILSRGGNSSSRGKNTYSCYYCDLKGHVARYCHKRSTDR